MAATANPSPAVLVVDDDRELADMYSQSLATEYDVRTAYDGEGALEQLDETVTVVLLDRRMPGLSGDDLLEEIRRRDVDCRVVMLTAVDPDFDVLEMEFDEYVVKPVTRAEIRQTVSRMVALGTQDEQLQEYYALVSKKLALESRKGASELQNSDDYTELLAAIDDRRDRLDDEIATRIEAEASATVFSARDRNVDGLPGLDELLRGGPSGGVSTRSSGNGQSDDDGSDRPTEDGMVFPGAADATDGAGSADDSANVDPATDDPATDDPATDDRGTDDESADGGSAGVGRSADAATEDEPAAADYPSLREADGLYAALFEHVRDAAYVVGPDGTVLDANDAFTERFGYGLEELQGEPSSTLYADPADLDSGDGSRRHELAEAPAHVTVEYRTRDGEMFAGETDVIPFRNPAGEVAARAAVVREVADPGGTDGPSTSDVIEVPVIARLLQHEIGNDLALVTGLLEQVGEEMERDHHEPIDRALAVVDRSAGRLGDVGKLLGASDGQSGAQEGGVDLVPVVEHAVEAARRDHDGATVELGDCQPATVRATDLLDVVVRNLVDNAVRHNHDDPHVEVTVEADAETARLRVADDGPGVPEDVRVAMLEPGRKGADSDGMGLGLYLVDRLVTAFDGTIDIEDNEPRGTAVVVELPLAG